MGRGGKHRSQDKSRHEDDIAGAVFHITNWVAGMNVEGSDTTKTVHKKIIWFRGRRARGKEEKADVSVVPEKSKQKSGGGVHPSVGDGAMAGAVGGHGA